jgi:signal transduction histidine kinase/ligand-binding sensor domain-containing protein
VVRKVVLTLLTLAIAASLPDAPARATDLHNVLTDYVITSWNNKEGLPPGVVWALAQDADGYLWVGNDAGLFRFDGERFVAWNALSTTAVPSVAVRSLTFARDASLWIGFGGNAGVGHLVNGRLHQYAEADGLTGTVVVLVEDRDGGLWAGSNSGLYRFANDRFTKQPLSARPEQTAVLSAFIDRDGALLVGTASGLLKASRPYRQFHVVKATDDAVRAISDDGSDIWISDAVTGFRVISEGGSAEHHDPQAERGRGMRLLRDRRGNMWTATGGQGLWRAHPETRDSGLPPSPGLRRTSGTRDDLNGIAHTVGGPKSVPYIERATSLTGLLGDGVYSLLEDRDGNIWAGTTEGVNRLTPRKISQMIDLGIVRGLAVTSAGVWVGTVDGLVQFTADGARAREWKPAGARVTALYADTQETIWVATDRQLVRLINGKPSPVSLPTPLGQIETITSDGGRGIRLYDVDRGLMHWKDGSVAPINASVDFHKVRVTSAYTDRLERAWFGLSDGRVLRVSPDDRVETFGKPDGLDAGVYDAFDEDEHGTIWLGASAGLSRYADGHFATLHASKTFPGNGIVSIASDGPDSLWIGGSAGIVHVTTAEIARALADSAVRPRFTVFDRSDGIAGVPVALGNSQRVVTASDGRLWFMTARGVTILNPGELQQPRDPSPVRIEEVIADGRSFITQPSMQLPPGTRRLEIDYTVINLTSPLKTHFRYRLEGFDPDWIESDTRRQVYTNLPPREYVFRVSTIDDTGSGVPAQSEWRFSIAPMFYQSAWFYAAIAATLIAVFGVAWQIRLRKVRTEFALLLGERARIGREIHDTLLQGLVGVSLQCDSIAADLDADAGIKPDKFVRMRKQVQEYIREAHDAIWNLRSEKWQDRDLGTALRESTEQAINGHDIRVQFAAGTPILRPLPKIEEQVLKIGKEAVLNAVHHAHAREISVDLRFDADVLTLRVSDDGCGFDPAYLSDDRHYGLVSMKERAAVVGGRLTVATAVAQGTSITATIPLTSRHA